jgi:hypothetical protein
LLGKINLFQQFNTTTNCKRIENNEVNNGFCFVDFENYRTYTNGNTVERSFLEWLIGFVEGDGSFTIAGRNSELSFVVVQKEKFVLDYIKQKLGFGYVCKHGPDTWAYKITNMVDLYKVLLILNGNILLEHRKKQVAKFVKVFNQKVQKQSNKYKANAFNLKPINLRV